LKTGRPPTSSTCREWHIDGTVHTSA
jgi:hypothetical protein